MTARERFRRLMQFQPVRRLPVLQVEPFEEPAVARWRSEGLSADQSPVDFLGMDHVETLGIGAGPDPAFEVKTLEENAEYIVTTTEMGAVVRRRKELPTTFYGHIDHPIKTRADWERYKERLRPDSPGRVRTDLTPERVRQLNASGSPVALSIFPFFFRFGFYTMGMERFLTAFHDEPDLIHEMFAIVGRLVERQFGTILDSVRVDFAYFTEDMAFKNGPLVSPRMYAEFWSPHQRPILAELRRRGVPVIAHWSAGGLEPLIPALMEDGFNCIGPLERMAGMDALEVRKRFGRDLLLMGNIPKEALVAGPAAIDAELERLTPLIREGGFLPNLDDMVPTECPFAHYRHLIRRLQSLDLAAS